MYAYCNNNPVNYVDPAGETAEFVVDTASSTVYLRGYTVVITVDLIATVPLGPESISVSFSKSSQDIAIDINGTIMMIKNTFYPDVRGESSILKECLNRFNLSLSVFHGAQWAQEVPLDDNLSLAVSFSARKSTPFEEIYRTLGRHGRAFSSGMISEGCGKNAVYGGAGGVFANSAGGIGGAGKGFNTMTFMFM